MVRRFADIIVIDDRLPQLDHCRDEAVTAICQVDLWPQAQDRTSDGALRSVSR
jgi:hypothetical protein